jgi:hypothetical protein
MPGCQEGVSLETLVDARQDHRSCGKIIRAVASRKELMALNPQASAACPRTSPDVQFSLEIRILHIAYFGGQTQMVVKMVVRPIANLSEEA